MNARWTLHLCIVLLSSLLAGSFAHAGPAGTVTHVSGPLAARRSDGALRVLSVNSAVEAGDTIITERRTYARIRFLDGSDVTLKPETRFKVEEFSYKSDAPADDRSVSSLVKGGLRAVSGQIGKRGDPDRFRMKTPVATIGIRGTVFTIDYVEELPQTGELVNPVLLAEAVSPGVVDAGRTLLAGTPGPAPGLYLHVINGLVNLSNLGGSMDFASGQFGHAPHSYHPPLRLPADPGFRFNPPPAFSQPPGGSGAGIPAGGNGPGECEVR